MSTPATERALESPIKQVTLPEPIVIDRPRIFVNPPTVHIGSGHLRAKTIEWVNQTGKDVLIWLPNGYRYLIGEPEDFLKPFTVHNGKELTRKVREDYQDGYYHYNVFCEAINAYAEGNSEPGVSCP
jgi:hypothetical protein